MSQDDERPDPDDQGEPGDPQNGRDLGDTQPVRPEAPSYPPPSMPPSPSQPGPYGQSFGQPVPPHQGPSPQQGLPPEQAQQPPYGQQQPTTPYAAPYGYPAYPAPQPSRPEQPRGPGGRLPGWAWPVITALALAVGLLGGVLGGVAVSSSMSDNAGVTPISTDNGAATPLKADNGSIAAVAARLLPSTVQILANGGADGTAKGGATGSGFVIDAQDHVITNNHVVADATGPGQLKVVDRDGTKHAAKIVGRSPVYDIAVLDVSGASGLRAAAIGSSSRLRVGDTVVAIGSPLGLSGTVTSGIVSATDRPVTTGDSASQSSYINALQTDAAINPGNSGGPLVNLRGQVVGVNSAIATTGGAVGGESGNIGVGFAIPMEQVRVTAAQILATGKARYPVIGANVNTSAQNSGAEVVDVPSGTPAADGGLKKGDVVTSVDGKPITDGIGLIVAIRSHQPGETIDLEVDRSGKTRDVKVRLDSKVG
ncbi:MAG: trypsin-like peptidase domain-containing protein [Nocardioidaceae bacterium]